MLRPVCCPLEDPPQMVSELVDGHTRTWNTDRVQEAFVPMDAELVLNIPLPTRQQDDWWAWHYEKRGIFTVRSTYMMLVDAKERADCMVGRQCRKLKYKEGGEGLDIDVERQSSFKIVSFPLETC
jgi:hypothetical protein